MKANSKQQLKRERPVIVFIYRLLARWVGGYNFLLLTTIGCKSGRQRTVPLVYMPIDDGYLVTAANLGMASHPGWYLNLQSNPQAHIQIGTKKIAVIAHTADVDKRKYLWSKWLQVNPAYQRFQDKTTRQLPMVILKPI